MGHKPWRSVLVGVLVVLAGGLIFWGWRAHGKGKPSLTVPTAAAAAIPAPPQPPATKEETATVPPRSNFVAALAPFHLDSGLVQQWITAARPVYNLAHIRAGRQLTLERGADGSPQAFGYQIDQNHTLWLKPEAGAAAAAATWKAAKQNKP